MERFAFIFIDLELWQIVALLAGTVFGSSVLGAIVVGLFNLSKGKQETESQRLKNKKELEEIEETIEKKAERAISQKIAQNEQILSMNIEIQVEQRMRKELGQTLVAVNQQIGGLIESEKNCRERQKEIDAEMQFLRETTESRNEQRHKESMAALKHISDTLSKCVITPKTS